MTENVCDPKTQLWSAHALVEDYVVTKTLSQLSLTRETNDCATRGHDSMLGPGHIVWRPSLASEVGVPVFWQDDVHHLRRFYAHKQPIDALLRELDTILRRGAVLPEDCELFAIEDEYGSFPYSDGDLKTYSINARYKKRAE